MTSRTLNHAVPLSPDDQRHAYMTLPADLTAAEAERLAVFLAAVAHPATQAAPASRS